MSYQSFGFIAFSAIVVFLFYIVGKGPKRQQVILALANLAFYAIAGVEYLPFILVTMLGTFFSGLVMGRIYKKSDEQLKLCQTPAEKKEVRANAKKKAKRILFVGMFITIALLVVCKYTTFILENVNSLLYMNNGNNFKTILNALVKQGYKIEWCVFNAMNFELPQHRLRVIIVGSKNSKPTDSYFYDLFEKKENTMKWAELLDKKGKFKTWGMAYKDKYVNENFKTTPKNKIKKIKDILEDNPDKKFDFTEDTLKRIKNSIHVNKYNNGVQILYNQKGGSRMGYSIFGINGLAPTLTASTSRHYERYKIGNTFRRLTNIEYARIQGFPDNYCKAVSTYNQYKLYGNAVPPQIIEFVMKKIINKDYTKVPFW